MIFSFWVTACTECIFLVCILAQRFMPTVFGTGQLRKMSSYVCSKTRLGDENDDISKSKSSFEIFFFEIRWFFRVESSVRNRSRPSIIEILVTKYYRNCTSHHKTISYIANSIFPSYILYIPSYTISLNLYYITKW